VGSSLERHGERAHRHTSTLTLWQFHHGRRRLTENGERRKWRWRSDRLSARVSKDIRDRAMATQHVRARLALYPCLSFCRLPSPSFSSRSSPGALAVNFIHHSNSSFWQTLPSGFEKTTLIPPVGRVVIILFLLSDTYKSLNCIKLNAKRTSPPLPKPRKRAEGQNGSQLSKALSYLGLFALNKIVPIRAIE